MPNDFPPWAAVYQQSQRWLAAEMFRDASAGSTGLVASASASASASGRAPDRAAALIDSRTLRSTPESGTCAGYDGAKRKRGPPNSSEVHNTL